MEMQLDVALTMGCNPIILAGCDLSYPQGTKYWQGKQSSTQEPNEWLLAKAWMEKLIRDYSQVTFYHVRGEGVHLEGVQEIEGSDLHFEEIQGLDVKLLDVVRSLPEEGGKHLQKDWQARWGVFCAGREDEKLESLWVEPMWQLWKPIFDREVHFDGHPFPEEEKLEVHHHIFREEMLKEMQGVLGSKSS
jgi:hypothetical protein